MIRCIHRQTVSGGILIDDIDDGLPNKEVHRLGSLGNPKQYERDGYANKPKQGCYVRYSQTAPNGSVVPGYVTLQQTNKVTASMGKGKIFQMSSVPPAGTANPSATFPLITVITGLTPASFYLPVITGGTTTGGAGPVTVTGPATSTYVSVTPDITTVTFARGSGGSTPAPSTLTAAQIVAAGGTVTATAISIPHGAFTTVPAVGNTVVVTSNEANSNTFSYTT
jgi:hypothetical protein